MRKQATNTELVEFRVTRETKQLIEHAASIMGLDVSSYLHAVVIPAAEQVVQGFETRVLSDRDRNRFLSLLDSSGGANENLKAAAGNFRAAVEQGKLRH